MCTLIGVLKRLFFLSSFFPTFSPIRRQLWIRLKRWHLEVTAAVKTERRFTGQQGVIRTPHRHHAWISLLSSIFILAGWGSGRVPTSCRLPGEAEGRAAFIHSWKERKEKERDSSLSSSNCLPFVNETTQRRLHKDLQEDSPDQRCYCLDEGEESVPACWS